MGTKYRNLNGFTFIEVILYVAIVSFFVGGVVIFAWDMIFGSIKAEVQREVISNLRLASKKIQYEVRNSTDVIVNSPTSITVSSATPARNPTLIDLHNGRLRFGYGNSGNCTYSSPCYLTSNKVEVTSLAFSDLSNSGSLSKIIRFEFNIRYLNPTGKIEWQYEENFASSAEIRGLQ